jgi:hypothetical protein
MVVLQNIRDKGKISLASKKWRKMKKRWRWNLNFISFLLARLKAAKQ